MKKIWLIAILAALSWGRPAYAAEEGPRQFVGSYIESVQKKNLYHLLGANLPVIMQSKLLLLAVKGPIRWDLKNYSIASVAVNGNHAVVAVDETVDRVMNPLFRKKLGRLPKYIHWGSERMTERFHLVKENGQWQFDRAAVDNTFSTFPLTAVVDAIQNSHGVSDSALQRMAAFFNGIGPGQLMQVLDQYAPALVPAISFFMDRK